MAAKTQNWLIAGLMFAVVLCIGLPALAEIRTADAVLPRDRQGKEIQAPTKLKYQDATATPVVSPVSTSSSSLTLTVPENATYLHFKGVAATYFGEGTLAGTAGNGYCSASAGEWVSIPCSGVSSVVVKAQSGDTTIHFFFEMISGR